MLRRNLAPDLWSFMLKIENVVKEKQPPVMLQEPILEILTKVRLKKSSLTYRVERFCAEALAITLEKDKASQANRFEFLCRVMICWANRVAKFEVLSFVVSEISVPAAVVYSPAKQNKSSCVVIKSHLFGNYSARDYLRALDSSSGKDIQEVTPQSEPNLTSVNSNKRKHSNEEYDYRMDPRYNF